MIYDIVLNYSLRGQLIWGVQLLRCRSKRLEHCRVLDLIWPVGEPPLSYIECLPIASLPGAWLKQLLMFSLTLLIFSLTKFLRS